ncbi:uncharacterized protein LOC129884256 [Solanum dulcamara]|uniref:uncharacterized protein LOC129884256 n=1 Tax=Solanum dulcamara TaxID=45834 RepID=UPI0024867560|nr:uncharacterized protein LOC129884256 [Solanum dulcamara]
MGIHVTPLQIQSSSTEVCVLDKKAISHDNEDEYRPIQSEDEEDLDQREQSQDEETSASPFRALEDITDTTIQEEVADIDKPWCIVGDFNVITEVEEKIGGLPYNMNKSLEFISVIEACGLTDLGFHGQSFTWCNNRDNDARIWKRLDRAMVNDRWLEIMPMTTVTHLASTGLDHCPLLVECQDNHSNPIKYFKFLHCWTENDTFLDTVKTCWDRHMEGNPMRIFHQKLKRVANTLSKWSRQQYGDIYTTVKAFEEKVQQAEEDIILDNSEENRNKLHQVNAEGRRRRLLIHKITDDQGNTIQGDQNIATAAYQQNQILNAMPTKEELKAAVFSLSDVSAAGPDGFNGAEVLSRLLNNLHQHYLYKGFHMEKKGPLINHLSFADDVIIFTSTSKYSLKLIIKTLQLYEHTSGQLVNKDKSQCMIPLNTDPATNERVTSITGFKSTHGPITYLGCPLYIGCQRIIYFTSMVSKVISKIRGWQAKILSYGGRATLVKSVLQSLPIHLLSAIIPTVTTLKQIKALMADFFWGWYKEKRKYHWASWETLSYPVEEGGIGTCSFWWDDWMGIGPLAYHNNYLPRLNNTTVSEYLMNGEWNVQKIRKYAPPQLVFQILNTKKFSKTYLAAIFQILGNPARQLASEKHPDEVVDF